MLRLFLSQLCLFWLLFHKADFKKKKARDRSSHDRIIGGQEAKHEEWVVNKENFKEGETVSSTEKDIQQT